jgi:hypothetical protein
MLFIIKGGIKLTKKYNINIITKFNNNGEYLENIIIKILNNNIFQISSENNK